MEVVGEQQKHFVLVHGACHGAWTWYKIKFRLESAGHRVTALDLSASGVNPKTLNEVTTLFHYTQPLLELMESIPSKERVILVGHSLGGLNLALAMDKFPQKIAASVFVAAFMPDSTHGPSYVLNQYSVSIPSDNWVDTKFGTYGGPDESLTSMFFGPEFLSLKLYQLCSTEDLALAKLLVRPSSLFMEDLAKANNFTNEGYGSVSRAYVVCNEDKAIPEKFQLWMIENNPVKEVREIKDADHMPMFSKPDQLCSYLLEIAHKYT